MIKIFRLILFSQFIILSTFAQTYFTNAGGDRLWSNPLNWNGGIVPREPNALAVVIPAGMEVNLDINAKTTSLLVESTAKIENAGTAIHTLEVTGDLTCNGIIGESTSVIQSNIVFYLNGSAQSISGTGSFYALSISRNSFANPVTFLTILMDLNLFNQSEAIYSLDGELDIFIYNGATVQTAVNASILLTKNNPANVGTVSLYIGDNTAANQGAGHLITGSIILQSDHPDVEVQLAKNSSILFTSTGWGTFGANVTVTLDPASVVSYATKLNAKIFLQGPYVSGSMSTALNTNGYVPVTQPYRGLPWSYTGLESVSSVPSGVVDWVLVELRTGTSPVTKVAQKAGFISASGAIVDLDGSSLLTFTNVAQGSYYLVVTHRNHLSVMSSAAVSIASSPALYDFTTGAAQFFGNDAKAVGSGKFAMYTGDANSDGQVTSLDFDIFNPEFYTAVTGYENADWNLDGQITSTDFNLFNQNFYNAKSTNVP